MVFARRAGIVVGAAQLVRIEPRAFEEAATPEIDGARVRLHKFGGLLGWETGPGKTFLDEIKGRVRVIACLIPDIALCVSEDGDDAIIEVEGPEADVRTAVQEIAIRATEAADGIPAETRQARDDGTTRFERILPGADRMYPDTDMPPISVTAERIERLRAQLPEPTWERVARALAAGVPAGLANQIAVSPRWPVFVEAIESDNIKGTRAASLLVDTARCLERRGHDLAGARWLDVLRNGLKRKEERAAVLETIT